MKAATPAAVCGATGDSCGPRYCCSPSGKRDGEEAINCRASAEGQGGTCVSPSSYHLPGGLTRHLNMISEGGQWALPPAALMHMSPLAIAHDTLFTANTCSCRPRPNQATQPVASDPHTCPNLMYVAPSFSNSLRSTVCGGSSWPCSTCSCTRVATALAACRLLMKPLGPVVHTQVGGKNVQSSQKAVVVDAVNWFSGAPVSTPSLTASCTRSCSCFWRFCTCSGVRGGVAVCWPKGAEAPVALHCILQVRCLGAAAAGPFLHARCCQCLACILCCWE